ncbi:type IV pilus biogenesis protein PilM [Aquibacillus sediminis]|uniref:type IV pilus biogenesis protein PilM n=1 Tax=Aquibacillus sediminis TaxID=2574734 RepID=UPI001108AE58|nr:pilus assembly protein PilM [Aquibacillus sediminis]
MLNRAKKHVNLIIKDQVIRYTVSKQSTVDGIIDYGEKFFTNGVVENGKIVNEKAFTSVLESLVREKKWRHKNVFFCVPDASVSIREQLVPKELAKEEIKDYIHMELEDSIRLPFSNPAIDFEILGEENEQTKILLFAYPKERLQQYLQVFNAVRLKPVVADISSLSLYRLYYQLDRAATKEHLLSVQWDKDSLVLTAFNHHKPMFTRFLKASLDTNSWQWSVADNELLWSDEAMPLEGYEQDQFVTIERFMDFYRYSVMQGEQQITKILLSGDYPYLDRVEKSLRERLDIKIEPIAMHEQQLRIPAKFADVVGLSIKNTAIRS